MNLLKKSVALTTAVLFLTAGAWAKELPNVHIIATGGTIAGAGATTTAGKYEPGKLGVNEIVASVPELATVANVTSEQFLNIASQDLNNSDWLKLAKRVNQLLAKPEIDGIVITHGTDVLEETAYFLQLTTKSDKPVVVVGAMRPATSLSADGPLNLYNAVVTAAAPQSAGKGVLVVLNGTILGARDATKTNTLDVQTFQSPNSGPFGEVYGGKVSYRQLPLKKKALETAFDITEIDELPKVAILYGYVDEATEPAQALIDAGFQGIVHAGVGNGNIHKRVIPVLAAAAKKGIAVVRSSRIPSGPSTIDGEVDDAKYGFVAAEDLNPQKARILLMLALTRPCDRETLQRYFIEY